MKSTPEISLPPTLKGLSPGEQGEILFIQPCRLKQRLLDLGFVKGTLVEALGSSPWGDPLAYLFEDMTVALRGEDAEKILVIPLK